MIDEREESVVGDRRTRANASRLWCKITPWRTPKKWAAELSGIVHGPPELIACEPKPDHFAAVFVADVAKATDADAAEPEDN